MTGGFSVRSKDGTLVTGKSVATFNLSVREDRPLIARVEILSVGHSVPSIADYLLTLTSRIGVRY